MGCGVLGIWNNVSGGRFRTYPPFFFQEQLPMGEPRKLSRVGLVIWISLPFVIVGAMWVWLERSRGRPNPELYQQQKNPSLLPDPMP